MGSTNAKLQIDYRQYMPKELIEAVLSKVKDKDVATFTTQNWEALPFMPDVAFVSTVAMARKAIRDLSGKELMTLYALVGQHVKDMTSLTAKWKECPKVPLSKATP